MTDARLSGRGSSGGRHVNDTGNVNGGPGRDPGRGDRVDAMYTAVSFLRSNRLLVRVGRTASSIADIGLLHPIVVTPDNLLIAGQRRIAACKQLGWAEIPAHVVDLDDIARGEYDENIVRKDFTPTEWVSIKKSLEDQIYSNGASCAINHMRTREIIAPYLGVGVRPTRTRRRLPLRLQPLLCQECDH